MTISCCSQLQVLETRFLVGLTNERQMCSIFVFISFIAEVSLGIGEHISNPHLMSNYQTIQCWEYFHAIIIVSGISAVKISIGLFLLKLVQLTWYTVSVHLHPGDHTSQVFGARKLLDV